MPTRRLPDVEGDYRGKAKKFPCLDPEHKPPGHMVFQPGQYEHTCPSCGEVTRFWVNGSYV